MNQDELRLQQLKNGDPEAYKLLVDEFQGRLFRFFVCHHGDFHLAEEQLSETFAQLVRSLPTMKRGADSLPAFVFSVARNVRAQAWKNKRSRPSFLELEVVEAVNDTITIDKQLEKREQLDLVLEAIGRMKADRRDVFLLRFVEGCSNEEIAKALDMPVGTVKSHIHRGRAELREMIAKLGIEL